MIGSIPGVKLPLGCNMAGVTESSRTAKSPAESRTEYNSEIIHVTSYHRRDFDLLVARINTRDHGRIRTSLLQTISYDLILGNIQILPLKTIREIISCLIFGPYLTFVMSIVVHNRPYEQPAATR